MGNILTTGSRVSETNCSDDKLKGNDVKVENVNDYSEPIEDFVMSEVSSLRGNFEVEEEEIDDENEENGFHVGDFVWGEEVNCHQWWPDLALKQVQKGKLLVAYVGDGNFAWCNLLQLKPFFENLKELSKISDSRSFLSAVEEAVREIGEHVEQFLVCDEAALVSSVAMNSGIKEGVVVPDVRREIVSSLVLENHPRVVLEDVKSLAKMVSFSDSPEIEVLKRKISAFYRCKGRFDLAMYDEHQYIIGLEHIEDESCQRSLRKCSGFSRKKRNYGDEVNLGNVATTGSTTLSRRRVSEVSKIHKVEEETRNGKSLSSRKRKKKRSLDDEEEKILDLIRGAALSTQYPKDYNSSCDMIKEFVSIYQSFTYHDGVTNKIHKRNISDEEKQPEVVDEKEQTRDKPNETVEKTGFELFIKTGFGSTLPSKDELIKFTKSLELWTKREATRLTITHAHSLPS